MKAGCVRFSNDEAILALVSIVRVVNPRMLESGSDGFTVDLAPLEKKTQLSSDEQLLLKLYATLAGESNEGEYEVELLAEERQRLVETLARLEQMQEWPADVLSLCSRMRQRLGSQPA